MQEEKLSPGKVEKLPPGELVDVKFKVGRFYPIWKNIVLWFFVGIFMGAAVGGYSIYKLNDWLMYRTVKTAVMLYPDSETKKDRIFDLKERL